jgi:hypothetical protein
MSVCEADVERRGLKFYRTKRCGRPGKVEVGGRWFCGIHDPRKKAERARLANEDDRLKRAVWKAYAEVTDLGGEILEDVRSNTLNADDARRCLLEADRAYEKAVQAREQFRQAHPELARRIR